MEKFANLFSKINNSRISKDERGAGVLEYIILAVLIIGAAFAAITTLGTNTSEDFDAAATEIGTMTFGGT